MEKIKLFLESRRGKDILTVIIIILVGLGSFGLGRISNSSNKGIQVEYKGSELSSNALQALEFSEKTVNTEGRNFFGSSRGTKYYPANCGAGKSLKAENRVYFDTKEEAEKAGYEMSSSCK